MIETAMEWIRRNAGFQKIIIDEKTYTNFKPHPVEEPVPNPLGFLSLSALSNYMSEDPDEQKNFIVHVESPTYVSIRSRMVGEFAQRWNYAIAKAPIDPFSFNRFIELDLFIIGLRSLFVQSDAAPSLLKYVGNLTDEEIRTWADDGITQRVTARTGVARVSEVSLPSAVTLRPFRTFPEIEQPASEFLFRIQSSQSRNKDIEAGLFEADGGKWKVEAIRSIANYFVGKNLTDVVVLA